MATVSSEDDLDGQSERFDFDGYSFSADVSESESSCSSASAFSHHPQTAASTSMSSSSQLAENSEFSDPPSIMLPFIGGRHVIVSPKKQDPTQLSEIEMMKERFAKLLLGEDMSGGGKGVCPALAISNAITNLSATVFGELWKLEPLAQQKKSMWCREMEWLLSVSDSIVELIPSVQEFPGGGTFEVMMTQPRSDLCVNLPALKKLDAMLISMLDSFSDAEFYYVDRGIVIAGGEQIIGHPWSPSAQRQSIRLEEKWWLPFPKVPPNGLSEDVRKRLQQCRECTNQIFKAAVAINSSVLSEMEIPSVYLESLPKSEKACLGETLHRHIKADPFSSECLLDYLDLSSEHAILEIANRIEAAVHIWRQKYLKRHLHHSKSSWGGAVKGLVSDAEKSRLLAQRADTMLRNLKLQFPGLPQTTLDMNKIQYNKDVGQSILESYSRVLESLAFNLMARIDDLLHVDDAMKQSAAAASVCTLGHRSCVDALPQWNNTSDSPLPIPLAPDSSSLPVPAYYSSNPKLGSPKRRDGKIGVGNSSADNVDRQKTIRYKEHCQ